MFFLPKICPSPKKASAGWTTTQMACEANKTYEPQNGKLRERETLGMTMSQKTSESRGKDKYKTLKIKARRMLGSGGAHL